MPIACQVGKIMCFLALFEKIKATDDESPAVIVMNCPRIL